MRTILILLLAAFAGAARAQTNLPPQKNLPVQLTEINSDSADFDLNSRRAVYRGHVLVADPKIRLKCEQLVVDLPEAGQHLSHVAAETNVVIDFTDEKGAAYHVTAANAVYSYNVLNATTNEAIVLTGAPKVETADATITSEPLTWDRTTGHFIFSNPHMISRQNLGGEGTNASPGKLF